MIHNMPLTQTVVGGYFLFASLGSALVAYLAATTPNADDAWSVMGSMLAGGISVAHAMRSKKSMLDLACVLVAAFVCGSVIPGVIIYTQWPESVKDLSWHAWAGMGFVGGLAGWSFTRGLIAFFEGVNWGRLIGRKAGLTDETNKKNEN